MKASIFLLTLLAPVALYATPEVVTVVGDESTGIFTKQFAAPPVPVVYSIASPIVETSFLPVVYTGLSPDEGASIHTVVDNSLVEPYDDGAVVPTLYNYAGGRPAVNQINRNSIRPTYQQRPQSGFQSGFQQGGGQFQQGGGQFQQGGVQFQQGGGQFQQGGRLFQQGGGQFQQGGSPGVVSSGGSQVFGSQGFGSQRFGSQGLGSQGFGSQGIGSQGFGTQGFGTQGFGSQGIGSQGFASQGIGSQGFGSQSFGTQGIGSQGFGSQGFGSQGPGSQGFGSQGFGSQGFGSQGFGSQGLGSSVAFRPGSVQQGVGQTGSFNRPGQFQQQQFSGSQSGRHPTQFTVGTVANQGAYRPGGAVANQVAYRPGGVGGNQNFNTGTYQNQQLRPQPGGYTPTQSVSGSYGR